MTMTYKYLLVLGCAVLLNKAAISQIVRNDLCQGAFYTEEQGARELARVKAQMTSLDQWRAHEDAARKTLLTGTELKIVQPNKTPLLVQYRGKQTFDGYTIENVIFESVSGFYVT